MVLRNADFVIAWKEGGTVVFAAIEEALGSWWES
jgi:hypothetical protein